MIFKNKMMKKLYIQKATGQIKLLFVFAFIAITTLAIAQPANDNPCNAQLLVANAGCVPTPGSNVGANNSTGGAIPDPGCGTFAGSSCPDVWYQVVVPASGAINITIGNGGINDSQIALYTGTCGAMTQVACNDDFFGLMSYIASPPLTVGSTVWIDVAGFGSQTGGFTICVQAAAPPPPPPPPCNPGNSCLTPNCIATNPTNTMCSGVASLGSGGIYGCLGSAPNPIWNVFQATVTGPITMGANSTGSAGGSPDIDYVMWGPFANQAAGCAALSAANILACNYSTAGLNSWTFNAVAGQWYVLLTTNYSQTTGTTVNWPVTPAGSITCSGACTATAGSNGPICAGTSLNLTCAAVVGATLYHWTGPNGFNANGQNQTIAGATVAAAGVYTVTVTAGASTCIGTVNVTVNALPAINNAPAALTICTGGIATYTPTILPAGSTYSWTASANPVGSVTGFPGAGAIPINNVLTNAGTVPGTVTYVITPIGPGPTLCTGPPVNFVVTVNPVPTITNPPAQIFICSGSTATYNPTANIAGSTFNYTATPSSAFITGSSGGTGNINQVINNTGTTPGSVLYQITPIGAPPSSCPGPVVNFIVNVYPPPSIANAGPNQNVCSTVNNATLAANVPTVGVGTWTTISGGGVITNISLANSTVTGLSPGANVFEWVITNAPCAPSTSQVTITVDPAPTISNNPLTSDICSGATASITPTSSVAGATFAWTGTGSSGNVTGYTAGGAGNISDVLTNSGNVTETVTYVITPTGPPPTFCPGTPSNFVVSVEPTPTVTNAVLTQSICSGAVATLNPTSNVLNTTFSWTATASAGTITGFTAAGNGNINDAISNTGATAGTVTYVITPTGPGASFCPGPAVNFVVTVDPAPTVTNNPLTQNFCSGGNALLNLTSNVAGATFVWTATTTLPATITGFTAAGATNVINDVITNTDVMSGIVTYVITASSPGLGCPGLPVNFVVTIDPIPTVTNAILTQEFCSGGTVAFTPTSNVTNATFTWTATTSLPGTITGFSANGTGAITDVINNSGTTSETVTYVITPIGPGISACGGPSVNFVVTIDPIPVITNVGLTQNICSGGNAVFNPTANPALTTFAYTASGSSGNVTGFTLVGGGNINDIITNTGTASETVTYVITPTGAGPNFCVGLPVNFVVTVDPTPVINNATLNQTICSGSAALITPTSNVLNTTFAYTAVGSSGNITGFTAAGNGNINDILTNSGNVSETVTYTVTPTGPAASLCPGVAVNFVVTVDPTPTVTNNPLTQSFCSGGTATLNLTSNVALATFAYTATASSANVTGFTAAGAGNINDVITNAGNTTETVTYVITPTGPGASLCPGPPVNYVVTIDPIPVITNNPLTQAFCSGGNAIFTPTSGAAATYAYTATATAGTVTGFTAAGIGNINDVITSTSANTETVTYVVTPTGTGVSACAGTPVNYVVTVDPIPDVNNAVLTQAMCSGDIATFTPTSSVNNVVFNWTATASAGTITGFSAIGTGPINEAISNTGAAQGSVTYVITPTGTGTSACVGTPVNFVVTIDPTPLVTNAITTQEFCSGGTASFILTSNVAGATFTWTSSGSSANVTGNTAVGGGNISDVLTNTGIAQETVTYVVTPIGPGLVCPVTNVNFVVTVDPVPTVTNAVLTQTLCTGSAATFAPTSNLLGTTFAWTATASNVSILGFTAAGTGNISDVLTNTGASGTVTYVITPTGPAAASCVGPSVNYVVTVNPDPVPVAGSNTPVCIGSPLNLTSTTYAGGTYSWTGPLGYSSAVQNPTVSATTTAGMAGTYSVTVTVLGCVGTATTVVNVNPLPTATVTGGGAVCFGNPTPSVTITLTGATPWSITYTDGTTPTTVITATSPYVLVNPTAGTYTITTITDANCTGTSSGSAAVIINPLPVANFTPDVTIGCTPLCVTYTDASTVTSGNINAWSWDFGDGGTFVGQTPPAHCYVTPGSFSVNLTVVTIPGCTSQILYTNLITTVPPPIANFSCPASANYYTPEIKFTDASVNATSWAWDFGDPYNTATDSSTVKNPTHAYSEVGHYCTILTVSNQGLCEDTAMVCVDITPEFTCFIPNAFSPNHDGINDEFYCKATNVLTFEMYIYDRWGNSIFYTDDLNKHWIGDVASDGNVAQEDVYVYVIKIKDVLKEKHEYTGSITLVR